MTRLTLWPLAIALGPAGWVAIVAGLGWWVACAIAALYLLTVAWVASSGGIAELWRRWLRSLDRTDPAPWRRAS